MELHSKIKTIIIGKRSNISRELNKVIPESKILSVKEFQTIKLNTFKYKINLIINTFYPVTKLNKINNYKYFFEKSILSLSNLLDNIDKKILNKIIYTSSSAVYGSVIDNSELKDNFNRNLYSYTKLCCENLIKNFCDKNNINFIITRVFNCYNNKDNFSVLNKIVYALRENKKITINNDGKSIRDFIHINDVAKIYNILIKKFNNGVFDVGTGQGVKIIDLLKIIDFPKKNIVYKKNYNQEVDFSAANLNLYNNELKNFKFKTLEKFFKLKNKTIKKYINENLNKLHNNENNLIIYGAGYAAKKIAKAVINKKNQNLIYFIDDDPKKIGKSILNRKIISLKQFLNLNKKIEVNSVLIAIPSLNQTEIIQIYKKILPITRNISSLPNKEFYKKRSIDLNDLIEINVEEILNRQIFNIDFKKMQFYRNKNILITGGAGSIGSEICKQLILCKPKKIVIIDQSEYNIYLLQQKITSKKIKTYLLDINNTESLKEIIKENNIDFIFHAAAYKHVKLLEKNHLSAINNNLIGTLSVLKAIENLKINLLIISTDKAVFPKNILGITKRAAEIIAINYSKKKTYKKSKINIVRFGNVFGSQGSAIETFVNQIKNRKNITITSFKMKRYFMSIREACNLVIQSSVLDFRNQIFILEMGKQLKIIDIIKKIMIFYNVNFDNYKIKEIGIGKGEKNYERLSYTKNKIKTKIKKIMISNERTKKIDFLDDFVLKLEKNVIKRNTKRSLNILKNLVKY